MSKFLRKMTAMSAKPEDFKPKPAPITGTVPESGTVPISGTVLKSGTAVISGTVPVSGTVPASKARIRVFRATRVEHGHSLGEHIIYEVLWRNALGDQVCRTIQIGYDRLASLASVNWKTAQSCLKTLEQKLAIEIMSPEDSNRRVGKTYRIHSFTTILERRRAAGMEWVEKGRGVRFIEARKVANSGTVPISGTAPVSNTVPETGTDTPPETGTDTVPATGTPLGTIRNKEEETSSSGLKTVLERIRKHLMVDDDVVHMVIRQCRRNDPECADDEIAEFAAFSAEKISRQRNVDNPAGLLISQVPKFFPGSELTAYRARKARELSEGKETARRVLDDPESPLEAREWAKTVISEDR